MDKSGSVVNEHMLFFPCPDLLGLLLSQILLLGLGVKTDSVQYVYMLLN